ncbi:MAG: ADP-glyceromanno-heptose 6-epimerase [Spirochaetes bacterium GWC1_27_15]|nr:MAG: ADP-glyceromanno-heptose 6-epimerase [Spirochaetes bacterium GWB1_27_13]OHD21477.1 MAG: ADP-glyceromanno-heptose 6-epimerase [Spirochaetes bacterium GWC1_27_15]
MVIVTGGAGFIGSNVVRGLNKIGIKDILIVDNLENGSKHLNLNTLEFTDYIDKIDFIENIETFNFSNVKAIIHIGACSNTMEYNGKYMLKNNYEYSKILLDHALKNEIKFIYASSASVYGNGDNGFIETRSAEYPLNVYAYSKFLFDQYIRNLKNPNTQIVGLRFFNVYGPQENHKGKMASVIYHFHNQIMSENKIKLFEGSQNFIRDFVFIDDIVKIVLHFYNNEISGIFNAGCGQARSFYEIADIMQKLYNEVKIESVPFPQELKGKYQAFTQADLTSLRTKGNYKEDFVSLKDGVTKYVEILKSNNGYYTNH